MEIEQISGYIQKIKKIIRSNPNIWFSILVLGQISVNDFDIRSEPRNKKKSSLNIFHIFRADKPYRIDVEIDGPVVRAGDEVPGHGVGRGQGDLLRVEGGEGR